MHTVRSSSHVYPSMHRAGGVSAQGGVCPLGGSAQGDVCPGGCLPTGVSARGLCIQACTGADTPREQNDRQV